MYQLEQQVSGNQFVPVHMGSIEDCQYLAPSIDGGYRIVSSDRKRLKNGSLSTRGVTGTRKYRPEYNYDTTLSQYIDWLQAHNKTRAYVFPEYVQTPGNYETRRTLKALGFELIEVPLTDYI